MQVQNKVEGYQWRLTYIDLKKSIDTGKQVIINQVDTIDRPDELEGFSFVGDQKNGIGVSSSRKNNVNFTITE